MATAQTTTAARKQRDLTECLVCHKTITDPRRLPCFHTFCLKCIEESSKKTPPSGTKRPCPTCKSEFSVPDGGLKSLPKDGFVDRLAEYQKVHANGSSIKCDKCVPSKKPQTELPTSYCIECRIRVCDKCRNQMNREPPTRGCKHHLVLMSGSQNSFCRAHERVAGVHCTSCQQLVCELCLHDHHSGHKRQNVENVIKQAKRIWSKYNSALNDRIINSEKQTNDTRADDLLNDVANAKKIIAQHSTELRKSIDVQAGELLEQLRGSEKSQKKTTEELQRDIEVRRQRVREFIQYSEELFEKGSAQDILSCNKELVQHACQLEATALKVIEPMRVTFKPSEISSSVLGSLEFSPHKPAPGQSKAENSQLEPKSQDSVPVVTAGATEHKDSKQSSPKPQPSTGTPQQASKSPSKNQPAGAVDAADKKKQASGNDKHTQPTSSGVRQNRQKSPGAAGNANNATPPIRDQVATPKRVSPSRQAAPSGKAQSKQTPSSKQDTSKAANRPLPKRDDGETYSDAKPEPAGGGTATPTKSQDKQRRASADRDGSATSDYETESRDENAADAQRPATSTAVSVTKDRNSACGVEDRNSGSSSSPPVKHLDIDDHTWHYILHRNTGFLEKYPSKYHCRVGLERVHDKDGTKHCALRIEAKDSTTVEAACAEMQEELRMCALRNVEDTDSASGLEDRNSSRNSSVSVKHLDIEEHIWHYILKKNVGFLEKYQKKYHCHVQLERVYATDGTKHCTLRLEAPSGKAAEDACENMADELRNYLQQNLEQHHVELCSKECKSHVTQQLNQLDVVLVTCPSYIVGPATDMDNAKQIVHTAVAREKTSKATPTPAAENYLTPSSPTHPDAYTFTTPAGITVCILKGNIVDQKTEAIVNPANVLLSNSSGAARAIADAAGHQLHIECQDIIRKCGKLQTSKPVHTTAGDLLPSPTYVIHVAGPDSSNYKNKSDCHEVLRQTMSNCIYYAENKLNITSLALPAISTGIFGVDKQVAARMAYEAIMEFDNYLQTNAGHRHNMKEIRFVDIHDGTVDSMRAVMMSLCDVNRMLSQPQARSNLPTANDPQSPGVPGNQRHGAFKDKTKHEGNSKFYTNSAEEAAADRRPAMKQRSGSRPAPDSSDDDDDDDDDYDQKSHDKQDCVICMDKIKVPKKLSCGHSFCMKCIDQYFAKGQPKCPTCGKIHGQLKGDQPRGSMNHRMLSHQKLAGFDRYGTIEINYHIPDGTQSYEHPNPGDRYKGTTRTAYLPANDEGREILQLLKRAFDARLVFTVGRSNTTGKENVVVWNDIHHKTKPTGPHGYPDPTYLQRVKDELAAKGIVP